MNASYHFVFATWIPATDYLCNKADDQQNYEQEWPPPMYSGDNRKYWNWAPASPARPVQARLQQNRLPGEAPHLTTLLSSDKFGLQQLSKIIGGHTCRWIVASSTTQKKNQIIKYSSSLEAVYTLACSSLCSLGLLACCCCQAGLISWIWAHNSYIKVHTCTSLHSNNIAHIYNQRFIHIPNTHIHTYYIALILLKSIITSLY